MFNVGGGEFLVIALVALIVLGPQRLPDAARQVGKAMGELRRLSSGFQDELRGALTDVDAAANPAEPASRRDVLSATSASNADTPADAPAISAAVSAVSDQPAARRAPLRAAPARRTPLRANPDPAPPDPRAVPKVSPPRTNGS